LILPTVRRYLKNKSFIFQGVYPFGRAQRSCRRLIRHDYIILGPHDMWHIDGHHKLIRYGLITHGGVVVQEQ
jgi:hypothetical protein